MSELPRRHRTQQDIDWLPGSKEVPMAGLFDVDLIPRILSMDRKVRLSEIDKRRERDGENGREERSKPSTAPGAEKEDSEKEGTIDITV